MTAKTSNAGQICLAPDYVLLPKGTEDAFVAFATKAVHDMYGALKENGDYSSIINERHFNRLRSWTEDAKQKGARIIELNPAVEDFANSDLHRLPPSLILDGERVSARNRISVINPATGKHLAAVPDVDRALLKKAISAARNAFSGWGCRSIRTPQNDVSWLAQQNRRPRP